MYIVCTLTECVGDISLHLIIFYVITFKLCRLRASRHTYNTAVLYIIYTPT